MSHPLLDALPLVKSVCDPRGAKCHVRRLLGAPSEIVVVYDDGSEIEIALDDDGKPGHYDTSNDWTDLGNGSELGEVLDAPSDDDDDDDWRREMAMEAGMLHGVDGYNEVMGY